MIQPKKALRPFLLLLGYSALANLAYVAALLLRFDGAVPARAWDGYRSVALAYTLLTLGGYYLAGMFHGLWRYAGRGTLIQILRASALSAIGMAALLIATRGRAFPAGLIVMTWAGQVLLLGMARLAWLAGKDRAFGPERGRPTPTLVIGADSAGVHLVQEMRHRGPGREALSPVGFLDDEAWLTGRLVEGVKVLGTIADLPRALAEQGAELVIVSDARLPAREVRRIARTADEAGVRVKTLPGLADFQPDRSALAQMRDVRIEDLLGRRPVDLNLDEVAGLLGGERVLVTGAGGSIGSELARQVAGFGPETLVLLDHAENGLYFVHHDLAARRPPFPIHPVVADIQDERGIEAVFARWRPTVVLHAAAHKHVPLLELNPREAVLNNVRGTRILAEAAERHGTSKFVLISTDKAVNPSSVMGASKRVCEMLLQSRKGGSTRFVAVRFGNVLGSDGSVVPLFQRQLERGGPLTVTHPDARRYFMTVTEAARLVLQAGAMGRGGEVFLLEMGEPVRILDLARQLIHLAGLREGEDVRIVFTGLRPGEKLFEELHTDSERTRITRHERILTWELDTRDEAALLEEVAALESLAQGDAAPQEIRAALHRVVPEFVELTYPTVEPVAAEPPPEPARGGRERETRRETPREGPGRRLLDACLAALGLALSAPLWLAAWIEARRRGEREILVHETKIGRTRRRGERRTAHAEPAVDRRSAERRRHDLPGQPFECPRFRSDLGPVSHWMGERGLDRIPRLVSVLRREMSLVGPSVAAELEIRGERERVPGYERRFAVPPGVTGLAQLHEGGDCDGSASERTRRDLYYVDNRSVLLDLRTLARTFGIVVRRGGRGRPGALGRGATKGPRAGR